MADQLAGKSIDVDPFQLIKFSALEVEDGRAVHHRNVGAIAIENIAAHDRPPGEASEPSCACWTQIARQFGGHAGHFGRIQRASANESRLRYSQSSPSLVAVR